MPVQAESVRAVLAVRALIEATNTLAASLRAAARTVHTTDPTPQSQREILADLGDRGPCTVPDLAAGRNVSRQNVQVAVNALADRGLVRSVTNPRHRRSPRFDLTPEGRSALTGSLRREGRVVAAIAAGLDPAALDRAAETLREIRDRLDREIGPKPA